MVCMPYREWVRRLGASQLASTDRDLADTGKRTAPPNTLAEIRRDLARLSVLREQIKAIEQERYKAIQREPDKAPHAMLRLLARVIGVGVESADMLVREILVRT